MDGGSQRTYVTNCIRERLGHSRKRTGGLRIKTIGNSEEQHTVCDLVEINGLREDTVVSSISSTLHS